MGYWKREQRRQMGEAWGDILWSFTVLVWRSFKKHGQAGQQLQSTDNASHVPGQPPQHHQPR